MDSVATQRLSVIPTVACGDGVGAPGGLIRLSAADLRSACPEPVARQPPLLARTVSSSKLQEAESREVLPPEEALVDRGHTLSMAGRCILHGPSIRWETITGTAGNITHREPCKKGKIVGQKAHFNLTDIWALRLRSRWNVEYADSSSFI